MISTVIDQSLGLEFPIFQGGMAWVADASLAAGVSNAGGLGIIAAMNSNGEQLREEIRKCKTMTDKIFGVNIMLMSPFAEEVSDVVVEEGIKVITTGAGNPGKYMAKWQASRLFLLFRALRLQGKWKKTVLLPLSQRAASQAVMSVISQQWLLFLRLLMQ